MIRHILKILVLIFAAIGFCFSTVFVGMQFGLFNVRGSISSRNADIRSAATTTALTASCNDSHASTCAWNDTPEWSVLKAAFTKDAPVISRVSKETGVPERLLIAVVVPEQMRFFTSDRELFKRVFEPLKILGSMSQFSLGVSGIKQVTADQIEIYASSTTSPFYPGPTIAPLIAYNATTTAHDTILFDRLTDQHNHYYSYLYTAIFIKEVEAQWHNAGFSIDNDPGTIATLFNLGFKVSSPKPNPQIAGSLISAGGTNYVYGDLATLFYNSGELKETFQ